MQTYRRLGGCHFRCILADEAGAFSTRTGKHTILNHNGFYTRKIGPLSMADVVGNWYFNRGNPVNVIQQPDLANESRDPNRGPDLGDQQTVLITTG